jgi:site-specific DNA recombinase
MHGIKVLMAKNYCDNLSEEVKKGYKQKAESGIYPCSTPPLGYRLERVNGKSVLAVDEKNKDLAISLFNWYATGLYSLSDLTGKVATEGLLILTNLPSTSKIKTLTKSSMQRILRNPVYYGDFYWQGKIHSGTHQALISKQLWDKVQTTLDRYENKKMISKYNTLDFIFKGLMMCGECGRNVTATRKTKLTTGKSYVYYNCTRFGTNCEQLAVDEPTLDKQIVERLNGLIMPQEVVQEITEDLKQSLYLKRETEDKSQEHLEAEKKRLEKTFGNIIRGQTGRNDQ